jgi:hypothetical protein
MAHLRPTNRILECDGKTYKPTVVSSLKGENLKTPCLKRGPIRFGLAKRIQ